MILPGIADLCLHDKILANPRDKKYRTTYTVNYTYPSNLDIIRKQLEKAGAFFLAVVTVPRWNIYGTINGANYLCLYQHYESLEFEILC